MYLSIIIPIYNAEKYISGMLKSIIKDNLKEIEIICIDDGSTDLTYSILNEYSKRDKRFIVLGQQNKGPAVARNKGLEIASGEYILFLDADDVLKDNAISEIIDKIKKDKSDIIIYSHEEVSEEGISEVLLDIKEDEVYTGKQVGTMLIECKILGTCWNKVFKRSLLIENKFGFEVGRHMEEWFPIIEVTLKAENISFIKRPLYSYMIRPTSLISQKSLKNIIDYDYAVSKILNLALENNIENKIIEKFRVITTINILKRIDEVNKSDWEKFDKTKIRLLNKKNIRLSNLIKNDIGIRGKIYIITSYLNRSLY